MRSRLLHLLPGPSVAIRSSLPALSVYQPSLCVRLQKRFITAKEKPLPEADNPGSGPNQEQLPHVSEEAAATDKIMGDEGPDLEQGTPVQEILKRDENSRVKPPRIIQEEIQKTSPKGSRPFSTAARARQEGLTQFERAEIGVSKLFQSVENKDLAQFESVENGDLAQSESIKNEGLTQSKIGENGSLNNSKMSTAPSNPGHIFDLPKLPLPVTDRLKQRYDPLVLQVTNLLMRDGKKGLAQRNMALILHYLRTSAPPRLNPSRPLLEGSSAVARLPLDPVRYLRLAIDSVAPLLRLRSQRGIAGGGVSVQIPIPLNERQRRRAAVMWILDVVNKRRSTDSGRTRFAHKVAEELVAIVEGRSGLWDRRGQLHKIGISARSNLPSTTRRR